MLSDRRAAYTLARTAGKAGRFQAGMSLRAERSMTILPPGVDWALERGLRRDGQEGLSLGWTQEGLCTKLWQVPTAKR